MSESAPEDAQVFVITPHDYKFVLLIDHEGKVTYCAERGQELVSVIRTGPNKWQINTMDAGTLKFPGT